MEERKRRLDATGLGLNKCPGQLDTEKGIRSPSWGTNHPVHHTRPCLTTNTCLATLYWHCRSALVPVRCSCATSVRHGRDAGVRKLTPVTQLTVL